MHSKLRNSRVVIEICHFSGPLEIHTDTAVSLSVKQAELLICLPLEADGGTATAAGALGLLHISALRVGLMAASGLDPDPEISIFHLGVGQGCVKYGRVERTALPAQLHFNPALLGALDVLVTTNSYCDR
jgi:hypothetical protein